MSVRVRFSAEQPGVAYVPGTNAAGGLVAQLFSRPLPPPHNEEFFLMDAFSAASIGDVTVLRLHVERAAFDVNAKNRASWTALHYAAYLGHEAACSLLLGAGAKPDTANDRGQTALMLASACGNLSCVRLLISKGASIDRADELDRQALHYAASCSQNTVVDALLEAGADANARDTSGMTPTLEACSSAHELTLLSLLEKGGDPLHKNKRGEDGRALAHDCPKILQIIQQSQSSSKQPHTLDELLEALQLSRLAPKFVRENVDLALFFELNEKDFDDMEIPYGPKKKMLTVIERFKKTGSVSTEAFETPALQAPTAGFAPRQSQSDDQSTALRDMQVSIQIVKENNDDIKQLALEALEKLSQSSSAPQLRHLLTSIIDNSENIAARISRHK